MDGRSGTGGRAHDLVVQTVSMPMAGRPNVRACVPLLGRHTPLGKWLRFRTVELARDDVEIRRSCCLVRWSIAPLASPFLVTRSVGICGVDAGLRARRKEPRNPAFGGERG